MVIETQGLTKYYNKKVGCKNISIAVNKGEIFGFLGPNGAGKSTFTKLMVGLIFPSGGKGFLLGKPVGNVAARSRIGYLPENFKYHEWMTGEELLSFHASLYKMDKKLAKKRIDEVLELVNLNHDRKNKIGAYSKGMQQRVGIASALLAKPEIIFFDEPTSALDPIGRKEVRDVMLELKNQGITIFLNSHLLSEIELICDSVAFIKKGTVIKQGILKNILEDRITLEIEADNITLSVIDKLKEIDCNLKWDNRKINLCIDENAQIPFIAGILIENGCNLYKLIPNRENLENLFINLIKGEES